MMDLGWQRKIVILTALIPSTAVVPFLFSPFPGTYHTHRAIAGYFQALAYWRDPLGQFFYNTPAENLSSIHFHSLLSAPFVGAGFFQGGRLVSLLAAIMASIVVMHITSILIAPRVAPVAGGLLWAHPLFLKFASGFMPEALSIFLTSAALLLLLRGYDSDRWSLRAGGVLLLVPAISTHFWEAAILLPLVALAASYRDWATTAALGVVGSLTIIVNWHVTNLQPSSPNSLVRRYALWQDPTVLLSTQRFWFETARPNTLSLGNILIVTLIASVLACVALLARTIRRRDQSDFILFCWLASGLSVPILLANGYLYHNYYQWGLLAPLSVAGAAITHSIGPRLTESVRQLRVVNYRSLVVGLIAVSLIFSFSFQLGLFAGTGAPALERQGAINYIGDVEYSDLVEAGHQVRSRTDDPSDIVFVGDWGDGNHFGQSRHMSTILIHSRLHITTRGPSNVQPWFSSGGPRYYPNRSTVADCDVAVIKNKTAIHVRSCSELAPEQSLTKPATHFTW
jgi:hypothetical protein